MPRAYRECSDNGSGDRTVQLLFMWLCLVVCPITFLVGYLAAGR